MIKPTTNIQCLTDFIGLQDDLTALLMCDPRLRQVFMVQERKLLLDSGMQVSAIWQTPRNGGSGTGIVIEIPRPRVTSPNVPGPVYDLDLGFVVIEQRDLNTTPNTGTFLLAEQTVQVIHDILHLACLDGYGTLEARGIDPANDWISETDGLWALRAKLFLKNPRRQTPRVGQLTFSLAGGVATLTCASNPSANIFYTTDGSFPANDPAINPQTQLYSTPFTATTGTILRAAAYAPNLNQSAIMQFIVT